jgi:type II secretory pathway pseudopilin PulG
VKFRNSRFRPRVGWSETKTVAPQLSGRGQAALQAFTMIEIAISLAVIGFALVAIIGIMPVAMQTQKENRQETVITQDASVFLNAIRSGERGIDDLTNYVVAITNYSGTMVGNNINPNTPYGYTYASSDVGYPITNGLRIVGLLSTPRFVGNQSNYVVAWVRSVSGLASEKYPQMNPDAQDFALHYRMLAEVLPMHTNHFDPSWTNWGSVPATDTNLITLRSNYWRVVRNYQSNFHDLRLTFRWPYQAGKTGRGRQVFRTSVTGFLYATNEPGYGNVPQRLYFFEPRNYVQVNP